MLSVVDQVAAHDRYSLAPQEYAIPSHTDMDDAAAPGGLVGYQLVLTELLPPIGS